MGYSDKLISKIKDEYKDSVKFEESLKVAPELIVKFFKELESSISKEIEASNEQISFEYGDIPEKASFQYTIAKLTIIYENTNSILFLKRSPSKIYVIINDNFQQPYDIIDTGNDFCVYSKEYGKFDTSVLDKYLELTFNEITA